MEILGAILAVFAFIAYIFGLWLASISDEDVAKFEAKQAEKAAQSKKKLEDEHLAWGQRMRDIHSGKINVI